MICNSVGRINIDIGIRVNRRMNRVRGEAMLYCFSKRLEKHNDIMIGLILNIEKLKSKNTELLNAQEIIIKQKRIIRSLKSELKNELTKQTIDEDESLSSWSDDSLVEHSYWT